MDFIIFIYVYYEVYLIKIVYNDYFNLNFIIILYYVLICLGYMLFLIYSFKFLLFFERYFE